MRVYVQLQDAKMRGFREIDACTLVCTVYVTVRVHIRWIDTCTREATSLVVLTGAILVYNAAEMLGVLCVELHNAAMSGFREIDACILYA